MSEEPYRAPIPREADPYAPVWAKIRRARTVAVIALCGVIACGLSLGAIHPRTFGGLFGIVALALALVVVIAIARNDCRCPRCGAAFFGKRAIYVTRCPECGIRIGAPKAG